MAGKGGGAWKVAYADFVTAMMAFFLVMWITAQGKETKEAVAQYFKDPYGAKGSKMGSQRRGYEGSNTIGPHKSGRGPGRGLSESNLTSVTADPDARKAKRPSLLMLHDGDQVRTGSMILFNEESAELNAAAEQQLRELLPLLVGKANKVELRGHATRKPLPENSPHADAWQLAYARSLAVMQFLCDQKVEPERIRLSQSGPYEPYSLETGTNLPSQNSRVEVFMLSEYVDDFNGTRQERDEQYSGDTRLSEHGH